MTCTLPKNVAYASLLALIAWTIPAHAQYWITFGTDISNRIRAVHVEDDDIFVDGGDIYVGGDFASIGGDAAMSRIARWDGSQWHSLGQGVNDRVYGIAVVGPHVYVTGRLTEAINPDGSTVAVAGVAMWDANEWHALGTGLEGPSSTLGYSMVAGGEMVYIGGNLTAAGGSAVSNIAAWDDAAQTWSAVGGGFMDVVHTLAYDSASETLYAGGSFDVANDGDQFNFIAAWDGLRWNALGDGIAETARSIAVSDSYVFVGGGSGTLPVLARWDGSSWEDLSDGLDDRVDALVAVDYDVVYASGDFLNIGGVAAERLAVRINGTWYPLGAGLDGKAISMKILDHNIVIGGEFSMANGKASASLAIYFPCCTISTDADAVPELFTLQQNYPNPFNPSTSINYHLETLGTVTLQVFDVLGRVMETLVSARQHAGQYTVRFDAGGLPSGAYVYTLRLDERIQTRAMLLVR